MRGAVAFTSSLLKRKLGPNSSSPSSLFSRLSCLCHTTLDTGAKKRSSCILGPDRHDIWTPLSSMVPPHTLPGGGVWDLKSSYGKVPASLDWRDISRSKERLSELCKHMDEERILDAISLEKDVDGFHPLIMWETLHCGPGGPFSYRVLPRQ
ncbi:hypothetical protein FCM35_KLT00731 [Carex littledalei]|uniref:Uncharacterized protein n=1 Tax=Carex littledalei TaxID=544730 RepID=A0A833RLK1_9POAL|nr:hypothetical protein FCM35_KLT00731 [Carex littledalei]